MYCHNCGVKSTPGTSFCNQCGTRLLTAEEDKEAIERNRLETAATLDLELVIPKMDEPSHVNQTDRNRRNVFTWLIPLLLMGTVVLSLFLYYKHETKVNEQVVVLYEKAEKEALAGRYSEAVKLLDAAALKRPGYKVLTQDRTVATEAQQFLEKLGQAAKDMKPQNLQTSEATIKTIAADLDKRQEPLFAEVKKKLAESQVKLAVMKVKIEIDKLSTVEALADKLKIVEELKGQEAAAISKQIISKMAGISYTAAEKKLQDKDYVSALQAVDNGLFYAVDDGKLLAFKERIVDEKQAYEQAENDRIEMAREQAAEEDLANRTAAVETSDLEAILDDYGDLEISGMVTNRATRPIYSINLVIDIYDNAGNYLDETYASVFPYVLAPGESGQFTTSYYGVYEQVQISVVDANWYLE